MSPLNTDSLDMLTFKLLFFNIKYCQAAESLACSKILRKFLI